MKVMFPTARSPSGRRPTNSPTRPTPHGEFFEAWSYDIATGEQRPLVQADWDVLYLYYSKQGTYRVSAVNVDASTEITVLDTRSGETLDFPEIPGGDVTGVSFSPSETKLAFYGNSDTSPSNLYIWDFETGGAVQPHREPEPGDRPRTSGGGRKSCAIRVSTGSRSPPSSTARTRRRPPPGSRRWCGSTAAPAARAARATGRRSSIS